MWIFCSWSALSLDNRTIVPQVEARNHTFINSPTPPCYKSGQPTGDLAQPHAWTSESIQKRFRPVSSRAQEWEQNHICSELHTLKDAVCSRKDLPIEQCSSKQTPMYSLTMLENLGFLKPLLRPPSPPDPTMRTRAPVWVTSCGFQENLKLTKFKKIYFTVISVVSFWQE